MPTTPYIRRFAFLVLFVTSAARLTAFPAVINFTANGFEAEAPEPSITGSIGVEIDDATGKVLSIRSVALMINNHAFNSSELGFSDYKNFNIVGAQGEGLSTPTGIIHAAPFDFWILWDQETGLPRAFSYTGARSAIHSTETFESFSIRAVE